MVLNKKGDEKLLSLWWFLCLTIVGVAIVVGVWSFYSADVDTKGLEADILANKIVHCILGQGTLNLDLMDNLENCYIDKSVTNKSQIYYIEIKAYDLSNCAGEDYFKCPLIKEKIYEDKEKDIKMQCELGGTAKSKYFSECATKKIYSFYDGKKVLLYVYAGSKQQGESLL